MLKITIQTNADFTPRGKRRARVVTLDRGVRRIRWYVSGRLYNSLPITPANVEMTQEWVACDGCMGHLPQPWSLIAS